MRILANPTITRATLTGENLRTFQPITNLQNFFLSRQVQSTGNTLKIIADYGTDIPDVTAFVLCGTNITSTATVTLSYSNTDPNIPAATIPLPIYTEVNQVWFFDTVQQWRYWVIEVTDSAPVKIGYLYPSVYTQIKAVTFPSTPEFALIDNPSLTATNQPTGQGGFVSWEVAFNAQNNDYDGYVELCDVWKAVQRIIPVVAFPLEGHLDKGLYRPRYCRFTNDRLPYPFDGVYFNYNAAFNLQEVN